MSDPSTEALLPGEIKPDSAIECAAHPYVAGERSYEGFLARPSDVARAAGGVLLCHGGAGLGDHERERARRLAGEGYIVLAMDAFGERFRSREHGMKVIGALVSEPNALAKRTAEALEVLREIADGCDRLAAIGFCFGGRAVLELARSGAPLRCVVSFHGGLGTSVPLGAAVRARVMAVSGASDPFVSAAERRAFEEEMTERGANWRHLIFGGVLHGFTEQGPPRPGCAYDRVADESSWSAMLELLRTSL